MLVVGALLFGLSGCAATVHTPLLGTALKGDAESMVFGRLIVNWSAPSLFPMLEETVAMALTVKNEATGNKYKIVCDKGGSDAEFFAVLPAGTYRLIRWEKGGVSLGLSGLFEASGGHAVYIGTLMWSRAPSNATGFFLDLLFGCCRWQWTVEDEYGANVPVFQERYPHLGQQIMKSIVQSKGGER
jgi:hypothetical protein